MKTMYTCIIIKIIRELSYLELMMDRDLRANVNQLSVSASISDRNCSHWSRFWGPSKPAKTIDKDVDIW